MVSSDTPRRSFVVHQAAEYLIGVALIASGVQSPSPTVPAVLGGIVVLNAAVVDGPLGAFRAVGRRAHRVADLVVLLGVVVGVVWPGVDLATRVLVAGLGIVLAFVVARTDYREPRRRSGSEPSDTSSSRGERLGRTAGRLAGRSVKGAKRSVDALRRDESSNLD